METTVATWKRSIEIDSLLFFKGFSSLSLVSSSTVHWNAPLLLSQIPLYNDGSASHLPGDTSQPKAHSERSKEDYCGRVKCQYIHTEAVLRKKAASMALLCIECLILAKAHFSFLFFN